MSAFNLVSTVKIAEQDTGISMEAKGEPKAVPLAVASLRAVMS
jgi:hypothetical protein